MNEKIKVLLIEDNHAYARLFRRILDENEGVWDLTHTVLLAAGLAAIDREKFDAVIVDLYLPDSQGMDSVIKVRNHSANVPIVVLTALYNPDVKEEALRLGAQDYLLKDQISEEELREIIVKAVSDEKV